MYTQSGTIKVNKKDIEALEVFLHHAKMDIEFGGEGTYLDSSKLNEFGNEADEKELAKGKLGLENVEFMLEALCPKWNNRNQI